MSHFRRSMQGLWFVGALFLGCFEPVGPASADSLKFENGRIVLETADKKVKIRTGVRIQLDAVAFDGDPRFANAVRFRRLRANVSGDLLDEWRFKIEYEFEKRDEGWRNLWLAYTGIPDTRIVAGNQIAPMSLENVTSSSDLTLLERSSMNAFIPEYYLGGSVATHGQAWTAAAGVFREAISSRHNDANRGTTYAGRVTWTPILSGKETLHLGLWARYLDIGSGGTYRVAAHPLVGITPDHLVNTHALKQVSSTSLAGLEAAWSRGPFRLQGEYSWDLLQRSGKPDPTFSGGYVQASWVATGEAYRYNRDEGDFDGVLPESPGGAWEIAARFGTLDLQDAGVTGGRQNDVTLGINWYPNEILRFGANYIWANAVPNSSGKHELLRAALLRMQISF